MQKAVNDVIDIFTSEDMEDTPLVIFYYYMALFITKINTAGTNFSYWYLRLLELCQNANHGD